jgi:aspartate 1-decarboxylase
MLIQVCRAKIHRARVTGAELSYEGSIAIDTALLNDSGIRIHERVQVVNLNNGERFETYVIAGKRGEVCLNGPAARLGVVGDEVIIIAYGFLDATDAIPEPTIIHVDAQNRRR